jgi:hydrophobe/amphiphile efflux-3 (HAE3) family protein
MFARVAAWAVRHARPVLAVLAVLAVVSTIAATKLSSDAETDTLVDADTPSYRATQQLRQAFGEEPVVVLAEGDLPRLVLSANLGRLLRLEGCLSGNVPAGATPIPGPCAELARLRPVKLIAGPATFLNEAVIQIDRQLRRLAARVPPDQLRQFLLEVAARYGITSAPSLGNPDFLAAVVFDLRRARGTPKARLSYLFPNSHSAQITLRLRPNLSEAERQRALELIRAAVYERTPRRTCLFKAKPEPCFALHGGRYVISGIPVVISGVAAALKDALLVLLLVAIVAMALTLIAVFRSRLRLLPLAIALAAAALSFGLLSLFGGSLTMASIAVLPILIGLAVDYAIQLQARFDEALEEGLGGAEAAQRAAARAGPTIGIACLATAAGFAVLQLSPTPMVRDFGLLLIVGIAIGFVLALTAGFAALSLRSEPAGIGHRGQPPTQRLLAVALAHPRRVLAVGAALAVAGWALGTQVETVSDVRELAPQDIGAVRDLNELQKATGVSGELDVMVDAPDLTDPATLRWMAAFKQRVLRSNGFSGAEPSCLAAEVCPGPALSDFVVGGGGGLRQRDVRKTLRELPAYDLEQVAVVDPQTDLPTEVALLSFGIRAQSLEAQQELIDRVQEEVGEPGSATGPPPGVKVELAGLPVIASAAAADLSGSRDWLTAGGLLAVALLLLAVYRSLSRALLPLLPVLFASGWAALVLWLSGIPLNPMSAALGTLTVAIATEFSVILSARFYEERGAGRGMADALHLAYARTGAAVLASGITASVGFGVLIASDVTMLRDFGLVTVIDLVVALLGVMLVLPAALSWRERR